MNVTTGARRLRAGAMAMALGGAAAVLPFGAGALIAQTVSDGGAVPTTAGLDIPANLQIFGKTDPNIRKPTAIVNNTVITGTDVDQRLALIASANGIQVKGDEADRLRLQVLRSLIDETLQIQEAAAKEITVTPAEIDQSFARVARNFDNRSADQMRSYLREIGSSDRSLRRQIEGELAWNRLLRRRVEPFVNVGDEEVQAIIERLQAAKGSDEFHVKEIYLSATPERADQVFAGGRRMIEQMSKGAPFEYFASNFSEASTRAVGGDLAWVRPEQLPDPLARALREMQVGQVAGPVEVPGGYSILYLVDKRQVLTADPRDARLSLRQLSIKFPAGTTQTQAASRAAEFAKTAEAIRGCGGVNAVAQQVGAEVVDNDQVKVRDLPPQLQDVMLKLQVGQATPPFGSAQDGVRVLVLCGRDDAAAGNLPRPDQIQARLEQERVNLRAQRMLRDLRRDAVVEYR